MHICRENQWSAQAFHKYVEGAVKFEIDSAPKTPLEPEALGTEFLKAWLDAALPAGVA